METNLKYINLICTDLGGVGGHFTNLAGENEICTLIGGTGGHFTEIAALNEICTIQGVTAGHSQVLAALNAIAGVTKVTNLEGWKYIQVGSRLNYLPVITLPASSLITDTGMTVGATIDNGNLSTVWSVEYGLTDSYGSTAAGGTITDPTTVSKALTGLTQNTLYYWRIKAVNSKGTTYSTGQTATTTNLRWIIPVTGRTSGTATAGTITIAATEDITPTVTGSATISVVRSDDTPYRLHVITLNCPNNQSGTVIFPDRTKIKTLANFGGVNADFYFGLTPTAPSISINIDDIPANILRLRQSGNTSLITITGSANISPVITYVNINEPLSNWTGLDFSGTGNISLLTLTSYRVGKMSSADMITLLTSLTNRVGTLPTTITINDYADYASPPAGVVTAVNALKAAKSITTVNLGA